MCQWLIVLLSFIRYVFHQLYFNNNHLDILISSGTVFFSIVTLKFVFILILSCRFLYLDHKGYLPLKKALSSVSDLYLIITMNLLSIQITLWFNDTFTDGEILYFPTSKIATGAIVVSIISIIMPLTSLLLFPLIKASEVWLSKVARARRNCCSS